MNRRFSSRLVGFVVLALATTACGQSASPGATGTASAGASAASADMPEEVTIAYGANPDPAILMKTRGFLAEEAPGVKINWNFTDDVTEALPLVVSNQVHFVANMSTALFTNSIMGGAEVQSFLILGVDQTLRLVVKNDLENVNSCADLAGHTIGIPFGGIAQYLLLGCLEGAGVSAADVNLLDVRSADIVAAWERGDIEGALIWDPHSTKLIASGGRTIEDASTIAEKGYGFAIQYSVGTTFAERYPAFVVAFLKAAQRTYDAYYADPEGVAREVTEAYVPDPTPEDYKSFIDAMALTHFPTCEEMLSPSWYGTAENPGRWYDIVEKTAKFLKDNAINPNVDESKIPGAAYIAGCETILEEAGATPAPSAPIN